MGWERIAILDLDFVDFVMFVQEFIEVMENSLGNQKGSAFLDPTAILHLNLIIQESNLVRITFMKLILINLDYLIKSIFKDSIKPFVRALDSIETYFLTFQGFKVNFTSFV